MYLVLEVDASQIPAGFPTHGTQDTGHNPSIYVYVTITLYGLTFQTSSTSSTGIVIDRAYNTTCPYCFQKGFSLNSTGFTRRYLRHLN